MLNRVQLSDIPEDDRLDYDINAGLCQVLSGPALCPLPYAKKRFTTKLTISLL